MRVGYAAKTISGSMGYAIGRMLSEGRIVDEKNQAPYLLKVIRVSNSLFDVFNSAARFHKLNKKPFTAADYQINILEEGKELFSNMEVYQRLDQPPSQSRRIGNKRFKVHQEAAVPTGKKTTRAIH